MMRKNVLALILVAMLLALTSSVAFGQDTTLVVHWKFDETEGLIAADASGNGNDGELLNMVGNEWLAGIDGNALMFDGSMEHSVVCDSLSEVVAGDVTVIAWYNGQPDQSGRIVDLARADLEGLNIIFNINTGFATLDNEGGVPGGIEGDIMIDDLEWHMVVAMRKDSIYSVWTDDGPMEDSDMAKSNQPLAEYSRLIANNRGRASVPSYGTGMIDDIRVYKRALSEEEINNHYNAIKTGTGIDDTEIANNPYSFSLQQNYPNPFNPSTKIQYSIKGLTNVELTVFNVHGQKVTTLVDKIQNTGTHQVEWNASDMPSGIYYYHLQTANGFSQTNKMILIK